MQPMCPYVPRPRAQGTELGKNIEKKERHLQSANYRDQKVLDCELWRQKIPLIATFLYSAESCGNGCASLNGTLPPSTVAGSAVRSRVLLASCRSAAGHGPRRFAASCSMSSRWYALR